MSERAEGAFDASTPGIHTYRGDLDGTGTPAPAGSERFRGTLRGRTGEFTLTRTAGEEWRLSDGSGGLTGISGKARIRTSDRAYTLDYDLPPRRPMPWRRPGPAAGHRPV